MGVVRWLEETGRRPIMVASHPRSGTHLLIDTLRLNFSECRSWKWWGQRMDRLYVNAAALAWQSHPLAEAAAIRILCRSVHPLIKTHATADLSRDIVDGPLAKTPAEEVLRWLRGRAAAFYIYRDGRNALCSFYEMESRRCRGLSFAQFIRQRPIGISRVRQWADHVRGWMEQCNVYCIAMEELLAHPAVCLCGISEKLNLHFDPIDCRLPRLPRTVTSERVSRLIHLRPESTAVIHPGGMQIDWRNYFDPADREFFAAESEDLLVKLGYEEDGSWPDPARDADPRSPAGFFDSHTASTPARNNRNPSPAPALMPA